MALQPGEVLDGKYRIVRMVGEGGMGSVYQGENVRIKRTVAIKVLHSSVAEKRDVVQRFEREAQAAGRIGSEHIVEVLDLGNLPTGERFMVMEFLDGESLSDRIKSRRRMSPEEMVPLLVQALEGLAAAHDAGIIHRDLKPDNIYLLKNKGGRKDFVKLLDFGVSKFSALDNEMSMTRTGAVMGTPYYMSPEQAKGGKIDARSDLYAIGVVMYQMVTGRVPFNAGSFNELLFKIALETPEPLDQILPDLDRNFAAIITRAMAREQDDRFQSARHLQEVLQQWAAGRPAATGAPLPEARPPSPSFQSAPQHSLSNAFAAPNLAPDAGMGAGMGTPAQPLNVGIQNALAASQIGMAMTPPPSRRTSTVVAIAAVSVAILGVGGVGAYFLLGKGAPSTGAASGGEAPMTAAATATTAAPVASTAATATETASEAAAPATADASASASADEPPAESAEPSARVAYNPPPVRTTTQPPAAKTTTATPPPPPPPATTTKAPPPATTNTRSHAKEL
ncbi:MAG: serine/threonine protein kinase [Myxococcales bacterium]|nr:serine/threonine protein kinase [Myxococcales bacterium]